MKRICVVGMGYIGLPTALLLSEDFEVHGFDTNPSIVDKINNRIAPFIENGLSDRLSSGKVIASTSPVISDVYVICVPTPFDKEVKMADMRYVKQAIESVTKIIKPGDLVIVESTITPGTCENILIPILEKTGHRVGSEIYLSHCPERAIPGNSFFEMVHNDRVIGGVNEKSADLTEEVYSKFVRGRMFKTDIRTAEFVKLIENTYRDVNIALANELAIISEEIGVNVWTAIDLANKHPRVELLSPGPGVGGHCLAVDPWFLTEGSCVSKLISVAREINDRMPAHVVSLAKRLFDDNGVKAPIVTVLGVSYKADLDDVRESPAIKLNKLLEKEGWIVRNHDPLVNRFEYDLLPLDEAVSGADLVVMHTNHAVFKEIRPEHIGDKVRTKIVIDTRNFIDARAFKDHGFRTIVLGNGYDR